MLDHFNLGHSHLDHSHLDHSMQDHSIGGSCHRGRTWRVGASWLLLCVFPGVMMGQGTSGQTTGQTSGAMLSARGHVAVNGREVSNSQALLPGDLAVTQKDSGGNLTQNGTNAMLGSDTAARYEGEYAVLERGGVSANTQHGFAVQAGCWTVKPQAWDQWTEYAVSYASAGEVLIQARGGDVRVYGRTQKSRDKKSGKSADVAKLAEDERDRDVNGAPLSNGNGTQVQDPQPDRGELLRAGQELRREACPAAEQQAKRRPGGAASAATTGPLNSTGALYGGVAAAGVVTVLFLVRHDEPASPKKP